MTRLRRVDSKRELERAIDEFVTKGYSIQEESQYSAKVKEKDWGSPPVHVFVFLFALLGGIILTDLADVGSGGAWAIAILATVGYAAFSYLTAEEVVIKVEDDQRE